MGRSCSASLVFGPRCWHFLDMQRRAQQNSNKASLTRVRSSLMTTALTEGESRHEYPRRLSEIPVRSRSGTNIEALLRRQRKRSNSRARMREKETEKQVILSGTALACLLAMKRMDRCWKYKPSSLRGDRQPGARRLQNHRLRHQCLRLLRYRHRPRRRPHPNSHVHNHQPLRFTPFSKVKRNKRQQHPW